MKRKILAAALALLLTSCGGGLFPPETSDPAGSSGESVVPETVLPGTEEPRVLPVSVDGQILIADTNGNEIFAGRGVYLLPDIFTNEPAYIVKRRYESMDRSEDDWVIDAKIFSTLYDLTGKELRPERECMYVTAFGDYLVSVENAYRGGMLERVSTGERLLDGVVYTSILGQKYVALSDADSEPMAWIDREGNFRDVGDFWSCYQSGNPDYYITHDRDYTLQGVVDQNLETVLPLAYQSLNVVGDYILTWDGTTSQALLLPECREVLALEGRRLNYFDGEVGIAGAGADDWGYQLVDARGEPLHEEAFDYFLPDYANAPCLAFATTDQYGNAVLLDRQGRVLLRQAGASVTPLLRDRYLLSWWEQDSGEGAAAGVSHCMVLDSKGGTVVPDGRYSWISQVWGMDGSSGYLQGASESSGYSVLDLLNADCSLRISGLREIYGISGDYISVQKGFSAGIMDLDGNWRYKTSIFHSISDE